MKSGNYVGIRGVREKGSEEQRNRGTKALRSKLLVKQHFVFSFCSHHWIASEWEETFSNIEHNQANLRLKLRLTGRDFSPARRYSWDYFLAGSSWMVATSTPSVGRMHGWWNLRLRLNPAVFIASITLPLAKWWMNYQKKASPQNEDAFKSYLIYQTKGFNPSGKDHFVAGTSWKW